MIVRVLAAIYSTLVLCPARDRLKLAEEDLEERYESTWNYLLLLRNSDSVRFSPYTVALGEKYKRIKSGVLVCGWEPSKVKDPVNIIAYGIPRDEFVKLLKKSNPKWKQILGTCQFLHIGNKWHSSVAVKIDIDKKRGERYHIRLFEVKTKKNNTITICAAHRDEPKNERGKHPAPRSFNEPRDIVMQNLAGFNLQTYLVGPITERNFRGVESDGKILFVAYE